MTRSLTLLDGLIEGGIIGVLLLSPLPFGSVLPWAQAGIEAAVALLGLLWMARMLLAGEVSLRLTPLLWPGLAMIGVVGLQLLLPSGSASPYATWEGFRLYVAYFGFLMVLGAHLVTRERIVRLLSILVAWGVALAGLGLTNRILGRAVILWFPRAHDVDRLTSTFVNPNHQALYFSVVLFLALGLLLRPPRRSQAGLPETSGGASGQTRVEAGGPAGKVLLVGAMVVIGVALVLTMSRGGVISTLAGLLFVALLGLHGRTKSRIPLVLGAAVAAFVVYASWIGMDTVIQRLSILAKDPLAEGRWLMWQGTLRLAGDAPLLGVGLGAFEDAYPVYRVPAVVPGKLLDYAHNDYLQLLAETGLVGIVVLGWALVGWTAFVLGRWVGRQDPFVRGLTMGGLGAFVAVTVHSVVDFGLHMPANALLLVTVLAILPAVVTLRMHRAGYRVDLREWRRELSPRARKLGWAMVPVVTLLAAAAVVPPALADWRLQSANRVGGEVRRAQGATTTRDLAQAYGELRWAARVEPWNPRVQAALAGVAEDLGRRAWNYGVTPEGLPLRSALAKDRLAVSEGLFGVAYDAYQQSLGHRPRHALTHDRFAWLLGNLETVRQTVRAQSLRVSGVAPRLALVLQSDESLLPRALEHLRQAVRWDPTASQVHRSLGFFALAHLREIPSARSLVADGFRQALTLQPSLLGEVVETLSSQLADADLLREAIPRRPKPLIELARLLERQGRLPAATTTLEDALTLASEAAQQREVRLAYARLLLRGKSDAAGALAQARQALVLGPQDPEAFATLGEIYEATKQWSEAESALASAVGFATRGASGRANEYRAHLASFLSRQGQIDRALAVRRQIVEDAPNDAWAHFELGRLLDERGEASLAFREYQAAEGLGPHDSSLQRDVASAYARNGHFKEATAALERAVRLRPDHGQLRVELAQLYARIGWDDRAREQYRQALVIQPNDEAARRGLGASPNQPTTP